MSIEFNGTVITRANLEFVALSMETYPQNVEPTAISKQHRIEWAEPVTNTEMKAYRSMAGELIRLGCVTLPEAPLMG